MLKDRGKLGTSNFTKAVPVPPTSKLKGKKCEFPVDISDKNLSSENTIEF